MGLKVTGAKNLVKQVTKALGKLCSLHLKVFTLPVQKNGKTKKENLLNRR